MKKLLHWWLAGIHSAKLMVLVMRISELLRIQADREHETDWETVESDIFSESFLLTRPLLEAGYADAAQQLRAFLDEGAA